jgi:hypothetical protein
MTIRVGIIGSAGRKDDTPRMSKQLYKAMFYKTSQVIETMSSQWDMNHITAVSGGAAWADHIAVSMFLARKADALELHTPARWLGTKFDPKTNAGSTANYYHTLFSDKMGGNTLTGIQTATHRGACIYTHEGFHIRNVALGANLDLLIAFTFGPGAPQTDKAMQPYPQAFYNSENKEWFNPSAAGLKPGGTSHCWSNSTAGVKVHVSLNRL